MLKWLTIFNYVIKCLPKVGEPSWVNLFGGKKMTPLNRQRLARPEMGKSQWDVAKETGIAQTLISLYERKLKEPKEEHIQALAKLYGRSVNELWQ